ncbi:amino acid permease [Neobacillus niacini]|uniref:amino acid permease n=1 Tax=Neobacillus niacini TaxID=86668 RepID=UPI0021CB0F73|nr:amino acid permease [Neobacillus niacini]MCM3765824.1 amino acid permease [Neobacillus niacini]
MGKSNKLGFWVLTALVVGNMVGSGIFMLPRSLSEAASPAGVISAWLFTGFGVLTIALVFGNLAIRKPNLTGGPQIYASALFKQGSTASKLSGFMSSWGYWVGNLAGIVAVITTFASYLSTFFPILTSATPWFTIGSFTVKVGNGLTFIICTALLWGIHFIILRGMESAGRLNFVATAAKVVGFFLFIIVGLFAFQKSNIMPFTAARFNEAGQAIGMMSQVNNAAVNTLWAFIGIESAMVFAGRAKKQIDVKRATILGLFIVLAIYIGISTLAMGMLDQNTLIQSDKPLIDAIQTVLGQLGGKVLAAVGLISLFGSTIGWVMLSAEVPYQAAKQGLFLPAFLKEDKKGLPSFSLLLTNGLAQIFVFSTISKSISGAFDFIIVIATLAYLVPYFISSVYQLKLVVTGETYTGNKARITDGIIALIATLYSTWVIIAGTADLKTFGLGVLLIASGILFCRPILKKRTIVKQKKALSA